MSIPGKFQRLQFSSDKPVVEDQLGTHKHIAQLLVQILQSESDNPLVVGLSGGWGTGKSSIAKMYERLAQEDNIKNVHVDCWAFANARERFGGGFLKILASELIDSEFSKNRIITAIDQKFETWNTRFDLDKSTLYMIAAITLIFLGLIAFSVWFLGWNDEPKLNLFVFLITTVVINGLLNWVLPKIMVTYESRTVDESFDRIEHFQSSFRSIMKKASHKKISVVVDNIDRVEPADALEIVRMLKVFVGEDVLEDKRIVFIVPCDESALADHITKELYIDDAREFLRKFFNLMINIPELVYENIGTFTRGEFEKIRMGLSPKLNDEDTNLVCFVISRATRRSPRQVKVLINSFVAYWQSAGLVGTAGKKDGISPLGAAVYVCLLYLGNSGQFPRKFSDLFVTAQYKASTKEEAEFLLSMESFRDSISDLQWKYLRKLQLSEDERLIPNFNDIYYAVTDLNWKALDNLIEHSSPSEDLINRLDNRIREEDDIAKKRFIKWVLAILAERKVTAELLPTTLQKQITHIITHQWDLWLETLDEGMAEFIVQSKFNQKLLSGILTSLKAEIEGKKGKMSDEQIRFVTRLIRLSKTDYWHDSQHNNTLSIALDSVIFFCIKSPKSELLEAVLSNINVIVREETGVQFGDMLANQFSNFYSIDNKTLSGVFDNLETKHAGPYSFAIQWIRRAQIPQGDQRYPFFLITLTALEYILKLMLNSKDENKVRLQEGELQTFLSGIENHISRVSLPTFPCEAAILAIILSIFADLARKLGYGSISNYATRLSRENTWPSLANGIKALPDDDRNRLVSYFEKYPTMLAGINYQQKAMILPYKEFNLLQRLILGDTHELENVLGEVVKKGDISETIDFKTLSEQEDSDEILQKIVIALYKMTRQPTASSKTYNELVKAIKPIGKKKGIKQATQDHMTWLISSTNWRDSNLANETIKKLQLLESLSSVDKSIRELLREKLKNVGDIEILINVLSDESRSWINQYLNQ